MHRCYPLLVSWRSFPYGIYSFYSKLVVGSRTTTSILSYRIVSLISALNSLRALPKDLLSTVSLYDFPPIHCSYTPEPWLFIRLPGLQKSSFLLLFFLLPARIFVLPFPLQTRCLCMQSTILMHLSHFSIFSFTFKASPMIQNDRFA